MEYRNLGRTGLKVSRICLGTNMMGDYVDQATCTRILDACLEYGLDEDAFRAELAELIRK